MKSIKDTILKEDYTRVVAPAHILHSNFKENQSIEGYFENRDVPDFMGSVRLFKYDTQFGTIQFGYNPRKAQSFIFANIKQSIYDTAASKYQREIKEYQMMKSLKDRTQNTAYMSKRRPDSAAIIYKADTKPWSTDTVRDYLGKANLETLSKTMPFLHIEDHYNTIHEANSVQVALQQKIRLAQSEGHFLEMAIYRAGMVSQKTIKEESQALIYKKSSVKRNFFRKLNFAFDTQKHEMFAYYKDMKNKPQSKGKNKSKEEAPPVNNDGEENNG